MNVWHIFGAQSPYTYPTESEDRIINFTGKIKTTKLYFKKWRRNKRGLHNSKEERLEVLSEINNNKTIK